MYSISEVSRLTDTSAHTIRYYEKEGLLFPDRTANGVRQYDDKHIDWLRFVLRLRATHMPIDQIRQYVALFRASSDDHDTAPDRLALLEQHQTLVRAQLAELQLTEQMITEKISSYHRLHPSIPGKQPSQSR